ncbi:MAG: hypothetical protein J0L70_09915 [Leptolyngbya sp. UWPOB_LEPTO1]|uniref:hypothetical protein n=1 Tax=Leptolyngbya sp. UWPOB_LEPTO1 TaxID=2815653 RepID=UPI001ACF6E5C|nr:hypothetical protein [Leptolyngbya sp. UWPOB_LEPTO1]MBN8560828.1 hypothetical protein [Leptolyngbya sp. UWPOB_LEPTO1]
MSKRISAKLTYTDRAEILEAINLIKTKMPFLTNMTAEERKSLNKMGDRSQAFVTKALEVARQNPDILPRSFDLEEMRLDIELFEALYPIVAAFAQLEGMLDDTYKLVGSEAYTAALKVYNYAKASGDEAGLAPAIEELGQRFARRQKKEKPQPAAV